MIEQFESIFKAFKHPKVKLINKAIKKQGQLFVVENEIDIQFNGYNSLQEYQEHMDECFQKSKQEIQSKISSEINRAKQLKQNLDLLKFEVRIFRKRYYPTNNEELLFSRIEVVKNSISLKSNDTFIKKNASIFID